MKIESKMKDHWAARLLKTLRWSVAGLTSAFRHEVSFRQEIILFCILTPVAIWLGKTGIEKALLISSLILVLIVELINSAIEAAIDRIGTERHPLSARAKDIGSAAVLLAIINTFVIWIFILILP